MGNSYGRAEVACVKHFQNDVAGPCFPRAFSEKQYESRRCNSSCGLQGGWISQKIKADDTAQAMRHAR